MNCMCFHRDNQVSIDTQKIPFEDKFLDNRRSKLTVDCRFVVLESIRMTWAVCPVLLAAEGSIGVEASSALHPVCELDIALVAQITQFSQNK